MDALLHFLGAVGLNAVAPVIQDTASIGWAQRLCMFRGLPTFRIVDGFLCTPTLVSAALVVPHLHVNSDHRAVALQITAATGGAFFVRAAISKRAYRG